MVFENDDFIVINKLKNISFHNDGELLGIHSILERQLELKLYPVHRLDKITTGLLIFAKSSQSANKLSGLFAEKRIDKTYLALSDKKPKKKQGRISGDMTKARNGNWKLCHSRDNPAQTQFFSIALIPGIRFFWIKPQTGKTHQIRVALKSIGSPILGDKRYKGTKSDRVYLHAYRLQFEWRTKQLDIRQLPTQGDLFFCPEIKDKIAQFLLRNY